MTDERSWLTRFLEDFGKLPEHERPPLIPTRYRISVFVGMVLVAAALLGLLLWLVVLPAIRAQQLGQPQSQTPVRLTTSRR